MNTDPVPLDIVYHQDSGVLALHYEDGRVFRLDSEFLRVHSPSAEVQGHGPGQGTLQHGKAGIRIDSIDPVGHYGIKPHFSDGHDSGIFDWALLYQLGEHQEVLWQEYLRQLAASGLSREAVHTPPRAPAPSCASHSNCKSSHHPD